MTDLWPVDEINPDDNHCLSLMEIRALCERIVDPAEMDRLRMNRIRWFNYIGDSATKLRLIDAQMADITDPPVAEETPDPLAKFGAMTFEYPK